MGSISKTFTATLAAYAQLNGDLSLSENVSKYLPGLRDSSFDKISLIHLGTHTSGGLPLQVPESIKNNDDLMEYLKHWHPPYAAGTYRVYSNVGIGLLGLVTAERMHRPFEEAMESMLLPALGLTRSYINVPADQMSRYAQGYTAEDKPIRVSPGVLGSEAYGIKSCSSDMIRFLIANMQPAASAGFAEKAEKLQRAINDTHTGYFTAGEMTQDLIWEQYPYPVELKRVLAGNSSRMINEATPVTQLREPLPPQANVLINKTGSTNGFAAYVAFIPARKMGIVILANKRYGIDERVTAAYEILTELGRRSTAPK
jgi:CubicO group peptidase (beta-lactamase class C family)